MNKSGSICIWSCESNESARKENFGYNTEADARYSFVRTALTLALQLRSVPCHLTLTDARPTSPMPQARVLDLALLVSSDRHVSIPVPRPGRHALARSGTLVG